jgi:DNA-binding FrmR family transcriptional regulator
VTGRSADAEGSPHCHVPATFNPEVHTALAAEVARFVKAAQWLARELEEERGCHAALLQVSVLQADLDSIAAHLVDGHFRYCVNRAVAEGQTPEEVHAMLVPVQSLLFARR